MSGRRAEVKGETQRRMDMAFRWVRFELSLGSVWTRRARFPGARALGGSSTWRLGGLSGRQLTGPVAKAPEVDLRSSAASRDQAELGVWCPGGADANPGCSSKKIPAKKVIAEKQTSTGGVWRGFLRTRPFPWLRASLRRNYGVFARRLALAPSGCAPSRHQNSRPFLNARGRVPTKVAEVAFSFVRPPSPSA